MFALGVGMALTDVLGCLRHESNYSLYSHYHQQDNTRLVLVGKVISIHLVKGCPAIIVRHGQLSFTGDFYDVNNITPAQNQLCGQ